MAEKKSPMFNDLKERYELNWCRKDQLVEFTKLGAITKEEFKEISGDKFPEEE